MAVLRCNKCSYLREVPNDYTGKSVKCPVCQQPAPIYDTIDFIKKIIQKYISVSTELRNIQQQISSPIITAPIPYDQPEQEELDIYNTTEMMKNTQYEPIVAWFNKRQIQVDVDRKAVDTTGFFDEIAIQLGDHYDVLKDVSEKIKRTQMKGYTNVTLNLSDYSQKKGGEIKGFCKELYAYSFVSKYVDKKKEKRVYLTLQTAPAIVNFFNGEWVEWFVFMKLLAFFYEKKIHFSCLRSCTLHFSNEDQHEVDVFFLINGRTPLFIECKSGEFRQFIEKYSKLRNRLNIEKTHFLLFALGLSDEQTQGLTSMYDITFVNERTFVQHISATIAHPQ